MFRTACSLPATFALAALAFALPAFADGRPNVVLILADDFGYECVSANGGDYRTPHLDALAAGGVRFTHCYSQPLCTPTRVQLMTGLYNQRNYVRFGLLPEGSTTFAMLLRDAGYRTCVAGKWQLEGGLEGPGKFGFDTYCLWQLDRRPPRYANPGLEIDGRRVDFDAGEYGPDLVCDHLCRFIREEKERPFLAYYPMILTHDPFEPTPDSRAWNPRDVSGTKGLAKPRHFRAMVEYADKLVGKIVRTLEEEGLRERTLVIFTGDNGTHSSITSTLNGQPYRGGKGKTTDAGTHVPLIANWPGTIRAGHVDDSLVDSTDFFPTLLDVAGVEVPESLNLDGVSLAPQLRGEEDAPEREWVYLWYSRSGGPTGAEFARDRRWKLYRDGRLFDVEADPLEQAPIDLESASLSTEDRARVETLQKALDQMAGTRMKTPSGS